MVNSITNSNNSLFNEKHLILAAKFTTVVVVIAAVAATTFFLFQAGLATMINVIVSKTAVGSFTSGVKTGALLGASVGCFGASCASFLFATSNNMFSVTNHNERDSLYFIGQSTLTGVGASLAGAGFGSLITFDISVFAGLLRAVANVAYLG